MRRLVPLVIATALFACRGDDDDDGGNGGTADSGTSGEDDTIFEVQSEDMAVGSPVTLRGVVITAIDSYGGRTGGIYVQEPDGGAFSGVFVYLTGTTAAELAVGDLVDVEGGVKDEFALSDDETDRTLTEVSPAEGGSITVSVVGDGAVPTPPALNPWDLAADDAEAEKWEGVPVTFENVRVLSSPYGVSSTDDTLREMSVTGPFRVSSSLTALDPESISSGDCYASITGIGDYFFSYKILPRSADDLVAGADGDCLPEEETAAACEDDSDNDYDGYVDCFDRSCQESEEEGVRESCTVDATVVTIQNETVEVGSLVRLTDVVVTGRAYNNLRFWVQDDAAAGPYNGVYAYRSSLEDDLPEGVVAGARVDLLATTSEYNTLTQISNIELGDVTPGDAPEPTAVTLADVVGASAEEYEGVLVTLENVDATVTAVETDDEDNVVAFTLSDGTNSLGVDDDIYRHTEAAVDDCITTITGIMTYNTFDDHISILPREASEVVEGQTCQ